MRLLTGCLVATLLLASAGAQLGSFLPRDLPLLASLLDRVSDERCRNQTRVYLEALRDAEPWALAMVDSSGQMPSGILTGAKYSLGNFDECLGVHEEAAGMQGQYCLAHVTITGIEPDNNSSIQHSLWNILQPRPDRLSIPKEQLYIALCVPSACSPGELSSVLSDYLGFRFNGLRTNVSVRPDMCQVHEPLRLTSTDIAFIAVFFAFIGLATIATAIDYWSPLKTISSKPVEPLMLYVKAFSVITNLKKLAGRIDNEDGLDCLFGIKFLSMVFVLLGHQMLFVMIGPLLNMDFVEKTVTEVRSAVVLNNTLFVDSFLLFSGFLVCSLLFKQLEKNGSVPIHFVYIGRFLRLTPAYAMVVFLYSTVLDKLGDGPLWQSRVGLEKERCTNAWWTNLLYINNYIKADSLCMFQSWYLTVDTQLFVLAPAIVIPLWRWPRIGMAVLGVFASASVLVCFVMTLVRGFDPLFLVFPREVEDFTQHWMFREGYIPTHMKATAYFCGIAVAFVLYRFQRTKCRIPTAAVWAAWVLAAFLGLTSLLACTVFYQHGRTTSPLEAALYSALDRLGWCAAVGWVIFACATENAGPLPKLLSWKVWVPLSRITYSAYLVNGLVELYSIGTLRTPRAMTYWTMTLHALSHTVVTFLLGLVFVLLFESPVQALMKEMLIRKTPQPRKQKTTEELPPA